MWTHEYALGALPRARPRLVERRDRAVGSGVGAGGLLKGQDLDWFSAGTDRRGQEYLPGISTRAGSSRVQCRDQPAGPGMFVRGVEQGRDPAYVSAGTEMWAQEYMLGISQGHELVDSVQGRDGGSEVVVGGLTKGRTQPGSGQRVRYGISDTLAWKLPGAEEPGRLHSMRSVRA